MKIVQGRDGKTYCLFFRQYETNGFCSNWYLSDFEEDGITYNCVEQYMMYKKAKLFKDEAVAGQILKTTSQRDIKALGRKVKHFNEQVWDEHKQDIVNQGVYLKFKQNSKLQTEILSANVDTFVECSPYDSVWGIKTDMSNMTACTTPSMWRGENRLGIALKNAVEKILAERR